MPRPVFIICAESVAHDKTTNLISLFHVLEGFQIFRAPDVATIKKGMPKHHVSSVAQPLFVGVAKWRRNPEDDPNDEYEYELTATSPGVIEPKMLGRGTFAFSQTSHQFFARMQADWTAEGTFRFASRIRKVGGSEWLSQDYEIDVLFVDIPGEPSGE